MCACADTETKMHYIRIAYGNSREHYKKAG